MSKEAEPWVRSAESDFQAAGHKGASLSDLHTMCLQIEDMVQSIALGLNGLTHVVWSMKDQIDHLESMIQAKQASQEDPAKTTAPRRVIGEPQLTFDIHA